MKPRWMRIQISCPDCGYIVKDEDDPAITKEYVKSTVFESAHWRDICFDCPKCKLHLSAQEFWQAHEDKLSHVTQYHNDAHSTLTED